MSEQLPQTSTSPSAMPIVAISTWWFGNNCILAALDKIQHGGSSLDAIEAGIESVERNPEVDSVGYGGLPNAEGKMQLDAIISDGPHHEIGCVMAVEGFRSVIGIARKVMERSRHCILVGEGAKEFAIREGFKLELDNISPLAKQRWDAHQLNKKDHLHRNVKNHYQAAGVRTQPPHVHPGHDTIGLLILDASSNLYGGCATSGAGLKEPGRVGDSPLIGSGLYVDNDIGAATATGIGEAIMKDCISFLAVEYMRMGFSPQAACRLSIERAHARLKHDKAIPMAVIAVNKKGEYGGCGCGDDPFLYAVWTPATASASPAAPCKMIWARFEDQKE